MLTEMLEKNACPNTRRNTSRNAGSHVKRNAIRKTIINH